MVSKERPSPRRPTREAGDPDGERTAPEQPDPAASSDGDTSWTSDPVTQDPDADRSVESVLEREQGRREQDHRGP